MAAITLGVQTASSADASTYATDAFTPAASDLLVSFAGVQGSIATGGYDSSDAGKTYTKITHALWSASPRRFYAFTGDQLADADSQTGTMDVTGDAGTACVQAILRVSGMTKTGLTAIRQFKIAESQFGADPTITFDAACLTTNPTIFGFVANSSNLSLITEPTGWSRTAEIGIDVSPVVGIAVFTRDSGFTGTTITATRAAIAYAVIAIELDASSSVIDGAADITEQNDTLAADGTVSANVIDGSAAITEQNDTLVATATAGVDVTAALAVTEQNDTVSAAAQVGDFAGGGVPVVGRWSRFRMGPRAVVGN